MRCRDGPPSTLTLDMSSICQKDQLPSRPLTPLIKETKGTYGQLLMSAALVGGSTALDIAIGIVRTKIVAILLEASSSRSSSYFSPNRRIEDAGNRRPRRKHL